MSDETEAQPAPIRPEKLPAKLEAQETVQAIIPTTIEEAGRYATGLVRAGIVPDAFREGGNRNGAPVPELILMGVLKVMEVGLPPQTGLGFLLPLNGRFTIWGDGATALVQSKRLISKQTVREIGPAFDPGAPLGEWPSDFGFDVRYWRVGQEEPYIGTFTVRDAARAGLWLNARKQPWVLYPKRMLFNRARAFALRDGFADALAGLAIAEEVMDFTDSPDPERRGSKRLAALSDEPEPAPPEYAVGEDF